MKRISVRQLTREFKAVIKLLPVIITDNGKDRYILKELSDNQVSDKPVKQKRVSDIKSVSDNLGDIKVKEIKNPFSICSKHGVYRNSCGCK